LGIRHDSDRMKVTSPRGDGSAHGNPLCAIGQPIGDVLDIAAEKDPAVSGKQSGTDRKI
jgi:hypothetical protein